MSRWRPTRALERMDGLEPAAPTAALVRQQDLELARPVTPPELVVRWDRQQWSAEQIDLGPDIQAWDRRLPNGVRLQLGSSLRKFVVGEYTAVDVLPHLMNGAPDEASLLYLATQSADETRHSTFISRVCTELLDEHDDLPGTLARAWRDAPPALRELTLMESELADDLACHVGSYERWLRLVTVFHVLNEGVLAVGGQRQLVRGLGRLGFLPGLRSGFVGFMRDEGRHVGFGLHALRVGIASGYADVIWEVVERAAGLLACIDLPEGEDPKSRRRRTSDAQRTLTELDRRLVSLGATDSFRQHVHSTGTSQLELTLGTKEPSS